jgi:hypothetical protein
MVAGMPAAAQPLEVWLRPFGAALGEATRRRALVLVAGALLAPGRRTVASALRAAGLGRAPGFANFHRVLSEGRWSGLALAERLLALLVAAFVPHGPRWWWRSTTPWSAAGGGGSGRAASTATRCAPRTGTS